MQWKILLAVLAVLALTSTVLFTQPDYAKLFVDKITGFFSSIIKPSTPEVSFQIILTADRNSFYEQSYKVSNSMLMVSGVPVQMRVSDVVWKVEDDKADIVVDFDGTFEITKAGSIVVSGKSRYVKINDVMTSDQADVSMEIVPTEGFILGSLVQNKISLSSVNGEITRLDTGGIQPLSGTSVDIDGFIGNMQLKDDKITLSGLVNSVKGKNFNWTG